MSSDTASFWQPDKVDDLAEIAARVHNNFDALRYEVASLYEEFDKLTKKAPNNQLSPLALQTVNSVIGDAKELLSGDRYVDRVSTFVAAGENPINSDVLLVLATLVTALRRFRVLWNPIWDDIDI